MELLDGQEEDVFNGKCPRCEEPLFVEEGFCSLCGALFCGLCVQLVDDDDEICPHCQTQLYFDCPQCHFELSAGTHLCPNCQVLFPRFCVQCGVPLKAGDTGCAGCQAEVAFIPRQSARVIHRLQVEGGLVEIVACLGCGTQFNPAIGTCPNCRFRSCLKCQISLETEEQFCPNCGLEFCPTCGAIVFDEASACPRCGTEFELSCPACDAVVEADAEKCPNCGQLF